MPGQRQDGSLGQGVVLPVCASSQSVNAAQGQDIRASTKGTQQGQPAHTLTRLACLHQHGGRRVCMFLSDNSQADV